MTAYKRVIIVGRINIGKSTLFNRLSSSVESMIYDEEGVTRDYIKDLVQWNHVTFELVDSAGLSFRKKEDPLDERVRLAALELLNQAQLVVFMVDGTIGILPEDYEIAKALHKSGKPVIVAINKIDTKLALEQMYEFDRLGFSHTVPISAEHGTNVNQLLDLIIELLGSTTATEKPQNVSFRVTLLGKPNVGKSSILNALVQAERSIVTDIPGTTRQAIAERIQFYQEHIELADTPGVRRPGSIEEKLESMMVKTALSAVRQSDIVLLVVDAAQRAISNQELTLALYAFKEQYKGLIVLFNKQDLISEEMRPEINYNLSEYDYLFKEIVTLNVSAKSGKNIGKILPTVHEVWQRYNTKFHNHELQLLFKDALDRSPLYKNKVPITMRRVEQIGTAPITLALYVQNPTQYGTSEIKFFENKLRAHTDLRGVPVKIIVKKA